ncbi:MAG: sigma 54-interacting transcriptional regulator [Planctomycetes bacterium]|nr:sigma 54-interacting transcriptional regulator [Planctomycetota bacterium]
MGTLQRVAPLLGASAAIEELRDFIVGVSILDDPVLLTGEPGTGKELAASKIHAVGRLARTPQIKLSCRRYSERQLEQLLFEASGRQKVPLIRTETATSMYLAAIELMPPRIAERLIAHLVDCERRGSTRLRMIFGSQIELEELQRRHLIDSTFLDLITGYHMRIPPLSERIEDIPILSNYHLWTNSPAEEFDARWSEFQAELLPDLVAYKWPGNVAELIEVVRAFCGAAERRPQLALRAGRPLSPDAAFVRSKLQESYREFLRAIESYDLSGPPGGTLGPYSRRRGWEEDAHDSE